MLSASIGHVCFDFGVLMDEVEVFQFIAIGHK